MTAEQHPIGEPEDAFVGTTIEGRFKVLARVAAGGMGVVYKAEQMPLGRVVALKVLEQSKVDDGTFAKRFFLEASAAARLSHPNTIVVHDYGRSDDGVFFIAMEFLDGMTLQQCLRERGTLPPPEAVHVGFQVCSSLRDAHAQGLVHRDLKPGNVMFVPRGGDPLFVKVLDFGLVKVVTGDEKADLGLTRSGVMMGSPRYMAPEQVKAAPVDHRTDIYSLGAMLHHVLAGAPPFPSGTPFEAMTAHVYKEPPRLRDTWPACPAPASLEELVHRCLQKDPAARPDSMDEVMRSLRQVQIELGLAGASAAYTPSLNHLPVGPGTDSSPSLARTGPRTGVASSPSFASQAAAAPPGAAPADFPSGIQPSGSVPMPPQRAKTMRWEGSPPSAAPPPRDFTGAPGTVKVTPAGGGGGMARIAIAVGVLALLGVGGAVAGAILIPPLLAPAEPVVESPDPPPAEADVREGEPEEAPEPRPAEEVAATSPEEAREAPPAADDTTEAPATTAVRIQSDPPRATVRVGEQDYGDTPVDLLIPAGETWQVELSRAGHNPRTIAVQGGRTEPVLVYLTPETVTDAPAPARRPQRPVVVPTPQPMVPQVRPMAPPPRRDRRDPNLMNPWGR